jgi:hypothetical protein
MINAKKIRKRYLDGWLIKLRCFVNQTVKTETAQTFCCPTARLKQANNQENPIPKTARPKPLDIAKAVSAFTL